MARSLDAKCKQCRREGSKLFLKGEKCFTSKCSLVKRNYIPGVHGPKLGRGKRQTNYGVQLREKQKAKRTYRILESQFRKYFTRAINKAGDTGENMFVQLEIRFDNAVYRAGLAASRDKARQLIGHGHFEINGKKVTIPSYQIKLKDKITIREKSKAMEPFAILVETLKNQQEIPEWLLVDPKELSAVVTGVPNLVKDKPGFDLTLITEYYSR
jgi:small subunit ribosomal protein S4